MSCPGVSVHRSTKQRSRSSPAGLRSSRTAQSTRSGIPPSLRPSPSSSSLLPACSGGLPILATQETPDIDAIVASARRYGAEHSADSIPDLLGKHGLHLPGL